MTATPTPVPPVLECSTVYRPAEPVSLAATLGPLRRGRGDPTVQDDASTQPGRARTWRTFRTPLGAATLVLGTTADGAIEARAWGDGAEWVIDGVPELLGAGDDWSDLDVSGNRFLHEAYRRMRGVRLPRTRLVFCAMVPAILEQKVTTVEALRAWRQLVRLYGDPAPGPAPEGLLVMPTAERWRLIPSWEWHRAGVDPKRSRTVLAAASVAAGLDRTVTLGRSGDEITRKLCTVPGVGIWTAAETTQRSHGDPDSVSVGDYHLHDVVGWALAGHPVDDDGMLELLEPWRGHRQRVMRIIGASGFRKPRFGPRITIQDHRRH
nr:DNA-3-methyladenine glycosylase 2 family protein [Planctomonas psychrotolerans]